MVKTAADLPFLQGCVIGALQSALLETQCLVQNLAVFLFVQNLRKLIPDLVRLCFQRESVSLKLSFLLVSCNFFSSLCLPECIRRIDVPTPLSFLPL